MRNLFTFSLILMASVVFAQNNPITFEPGEFGADFTWATFEAPEGEDNPTFTVEANPVTDGINSSATAAKIAISYGTDASWGQAGCETSQTEMDMGSWEFTEENSTVTMMIYQEGFAAPVALKFANATFGAEFETIVENDVADEWVEVSFDMSSLIGSGLAPFTQFIFFPSYGPRETGHTVWFDNVVFGAGDPPAGDPMVSAPEPTIDEAEVLSVYSETYQTNTVTNFNLNSFQGGGTISEIDIEEDGNNTIEIEGLTFYGAEWDAVDLNDFEYVHFHYWASTSTAFNFYLIDATAEIPGGNPAEPRYSFGLQGGDETLVQGEWVSVFIPLQHFLDYPSTGYDYDLNDIFQWKFDGNGNLFIDNVFFTSADPLSASQVKIEGLEVFPNPSNNGWNIQTAGAEIQEVRIFNALGQAVASFNPRSNSFRIEADQLKPGLYLANLITNEGSQTIRLVNQR